MTTATVYHGDNLQVLKQLPDKSIDLIYVDPPFNTGKSQKLSGLKYADTFDDLVEFLKPRIVETHRVLKDNGSFYFHLDYREIHYCKVMIDSIFGRHNFVNEIIWAYDYGARTTKRWPAKHDNILFYAKDINNYTFNLDAVERIPYMAPGLVGPEKAAFGKSPTSCFWITIVPTMSKERTGYPTQKPLKLLDRFILASSNPGDTVLDYFCGSGTTGISAMQNGRNCILVDQNPQAIEVVKNRLVESLYDYEIIEL